jgi:hypothetical protein
VLEYGNENPLPARPAYQELRPYGWLVKYGQRLGAGHPGYDRSPDDYKSEAAGDPYLFGISQSIDENINRPGAYSAITEKRLVGPLCSLLTPAWPAPRGCKNG